MQNKPTDAALKAALARLTEVVKKRPKWPWLKLDDGSAVGFREGEVLHRGRHRKDC